LKEDVLVREWLSEQRQPRERGKQLVQVDLARTECDRGKNMTKRARDSQDDASSQVAAAEVPRRKKTRVSVPADDASLSSKPHQFGGLLSATAAKVKKALKKGTLQPTKRQLISGRLNKLAVPKPQSLAARKGGSGSTRPDINRRGNKINKGWGTGGFDTTPLAGGAKEDVGEVAGSSREHKQGKPTVPVGAEMWITRKSSYPAYLKSGVAAFMHKGFVHVFLRLAYLVAIIILTGYYCTETTHSS
jgi:hypothetical protein